MIVYDIRYNKPTHFSNPNHNGHTGVFLRAFYDENGLISGTSCFETEKGLELLFNSRGKVKMEHHPIKHHQYIGKNIDSYAKILGVNYLYGTYNKKTSVSTLEKLFPEWTISQDGNLFKMEIWART